ncbi:MAG TPA: carbohydrate porin [Methylococcaceae bacterium]|nr:carbohydrate porin [Methylococcaceae bacterium]
MRTLITGITLSLLATTALAEEAPPSFGGDLLTRPKLTGDWGGVRDDLASHGVTLDLDATQVTQHVADGGFEGRLFNRLFPEKHETEGSAMFNMLLKLDTGKAGLWPGGFLTVRGEGRVGDSVDPRAGALMPVNGDAILPTVPGHGGQDVLALTELTYAQFFSPQFGLVAGLLNMAEGDSNELAGSLRSRSKFLNTAFRLSPVFIGAAPVVALGAMAVFIPNDDILGTAGFLNSEESAGFNPFEEDAGTSFATEWKFKHQLAGLPGKQTFGFIYAFDRDRIDLGADPRLHVISLATTGSPVVTGDESWTLYYNAHQYLHGDEKGGFGLFVRAGVSDGHPSPIKWNTAFGLGGRGVGSSRPDDTWGIGGFAVGASNEPVLNTFQIHDETGFEAWYNVALAPWLHVTGDVQYVDSAIQRADSAWVVGARTEINF